MKKIGIFAGTFDPVHDGHLAFAQAALDEGLEKVMFLVEPRPRRKQGVRALQHRQAMIQHALVKNPKFATIVLEQARFSVDETLPVLQARFPGYKLVFLFGDDVISHIAHWPHVADLVSSVELLVAYRHHNDNNLRAAFKTLETTRNLAFKYSAVRPQHQHVASSKIRLQLKRGQPPQGLPAGVLTYIRKHRLYESVASDPK
jgi:nicotinate-nucleotide adenylyltransferase